MLTHETTKPFTDKGLLGGGPAIGMGNRRIFATAIYKINEITWVPPKILKSDTAKKMGERFPMLAVTSKTDESFGTWLEKAVERIISSRSMEQGILHTFAGYKPEGFDDRRFLSLLENPDLANLSAHPGYVIGSLQNIASSDISGVDLSFEDWELILSTESSSNLSELDRLSFEKAITELRNSSTSDLSLT